MGPNRQLLFVQGAGDGTYDDWDAKLVASLRQHLGSGYEIHYPRMPQEHEPTYARWRPVLAKELSSLRSDAILVGHSLGAAMLVKLLGSAPPRSFGALFLLAAPYVGEGGWDGDELQCPRDLARHLPRGVPVHLFHGLKDLVVPAAHLDLYARALPEARAHRIAEGDHQLNEDLKEVAALILALKS